MADYETHCRLIQEAYEGSLDESAQEALWSRLFLPPKVAAAFRDAANGSEVFDWPERDRRCGWVCTAAYTKVSVDVSEYEPEDLANGLRELATEQRLAEIETGAPLTDQELADLRQSVAERDQFERGTVIYAFETEGRDGDTLTFVEEVGDWGEVVGWFGPYLQYESWESEVAGEDDLLLGDDACRAKTPEPEFEEEEDEEEVSDEDVASSELEARDPPVKSFVCTVVVSEMSEEAHVDLHFIRAGGKDRMETQRFAWLWVERASEGGVEDSTRAMLQRILRVAECYFRIQGFALAGSIGVDECEAILASAREETARVVEANQADAEKPIVLAARKLSLSPSPSEIDLGIWDAMCPGTSHRLLLNTKRNEYWCGYCQVTGDVKALRELAQERGRQP